MNYLAARKSIAWHNNYSFVPNTENRKKIENESSADTRMCWTCGSCDFECPVNIFTGYLKPQKLVRLGNLGFLDELLFLNEIWYCLNCRRCGEACPNKVKPWALIEYAQQAAIFQKKVSWKTVQFCRSLWIRFQKVITNHLCDVLRLREVSLEEVLRARLIIEPEVAAEAVGFPFVASLRLLIFFVPISHFSGWSGFNCDRDNYFSPFP